MGPALLAQAAPAPSSAELVVFVIVGALSLGSAMSMVLMRNAVHAALMLVVNLFTIAVLYAVQEAQFLATVQIIVYAGAIMVLFLFVIMLLGVAKSDSPLRRGIRSQKLSGIVLGLVLFAGLAAAVGGPYLSRSSACPSPPPAQGEVATDAVCVGLAAANEPGNTEAIGALLFGRFVWPFEVISVLLVIAAIGAMVLGKRTEQPEELVDRVEVPVEAAPADESDVEPAMIGQGGGATAALHERQGNPAPSSSPQEDV